MAPLVFVEAKRYEDSTGLSRRDLAGELAEAVDRYPHVDLWVLAATKEVGSDEDGLLKREGTRRAVEILVLDVRDAGVGPLQVLCAAFADTTMAFLKKHAPPGTLNPAALSSRLDAIQKAPGYNDALRAQEETTRGLLLGYADACARMADGLRRHVAGVDDAKVAFNQDIALTASGRQPIRREFIAGDLDGWWTAESPPHFVLLGAKGAGKTWAVFGWLLDLIDQADPPLVIPVTSNMAPSADVLDVVAETLERCLRNSLGKPIEWWRRRVGFWLRAPTSEARMLVVLDGLNEAPDAPWRGLLASAGATDINGCVRLLMTSRKPYWTQHVPVSPNTVKERDTVGYEGNGTDRHNELREALAPDLVPEDLPDELLALVQQPLYCDLVVKHFRELVETGDFTVERLLYLEAREYQFRKLGQPVTDERFHQILGDLARRHVEAWQMRQPAPRFGENDLKALGGDAPKVLQEIVDGGLLRPSGRRSQPYEVDPTRLTYGLGMLLAEYIRECGRTTVGNLAEEAEAWLEPHPDMDLKTAALGAAVFFSLEQTTPDYPQAHRQALLRLWIRARNREEPIAHAVSAYLMDCPADVLVVADHFWRAAYDLPTVQRAYATVLLRRWNTQALRSHLVAAVERWMGYVQVAGHPTQRNFADFHPDPRRPAERLAQRLGVAAEPGTSVQFQDWRLPVTNDDGHLRLARFAIMLVSSGPRQPFLKALVLWAVSRRLMEDTSEYREVAWTLRLPDEDLWPALKAELGTMAQSSDDVVRRAADMLLEALGVREARALRKLVLAELHPKTDDQIAHEADPCTSYYALERDHCESCLARPDVALWQLLEKVAPIFADPALTAPELFVERLKESAKGLAGEAIWQFEGVSPQGHLAEQHLPALARFAPTSLGDLMRRAWESREARSPGNARGLMINLKAVAPLLSAESIPILDAYVSRLPVGDADGRNEDRIVEACGFLALAMILPTEVAAQRLVDRPPEALDLITLGPWFQPLPGAQVAALTQRLLVETDPVRLARILWLLRHAETTLTEQHRIVILAAAHGSLGHLSAAALEYIFRSRDLDLVAGVLDGASSFTSTDDSSTRCAWGIAVLCENAAKLSATDLLERLPISAIGAALVRRGTMQHDAGWYADNLDAAWRALDRTDQEWFGVASPEITFRGSDGNRVPCVGEPRRAGGTRFVSANYTWGGHTSDSAADAFRAILAPDPNALATQQNRYFEAFSRALKRASEGFWTMQVDTDALRAVNAVRPDLVREWCDAVMADDGAAYSRLLRASGFYQSLCHSLAKDDPGRAFALRDRLMRVDHVRFRDTHAGTDELTALPFSAPETSEALAARQAMMDEAMSDAALLELATMAAAFSRSDWIDGQAHSLVSSPSLWRKAKGAMLAALSDLDEATVEAVLKKIGPDVAGSWVERLVPAMRDGHRRNLWARHWYRQFLTASGWDEAYAAFTLFLGCADRRCRLWMDREDEDALAMEGFDERKLLYRRTNADAIDDAIGRNEKERKTHFLTLPFEARQLVPFGGP